MSSPARTLPPGQPQPENQAAELEFWQSHVSHWDLHLPTYLRALPFSEVDFDRTAILDVGSGPISVFEKVAPPSARVVGYDSLADEYNRLAPEKRFPVVSQLPPGPFQLITSFNCLDHMDRPDELLAELSHVVEPGGRLWIYCHIGRPYGAEAHPQDFRFWHLVKLTNRSFRLMRCGLIREGLLFPYAWWGVCASREGGRTLSDWPREAFWNAVCAVYFARFHGIRALVKGLKLIGLRHLLPPEFRF
jgi:SAM-dependent methyltransferase